MGNLRPLEGDPADRSIKTYQGTVVKVGGVLKVNVGGNTVPARWADPLVVAEGDPVLVDIDYSRSGQGAAVVRCRLTDKSRPGQGTVLTVPASSPTITVTGSDGATYTATFVSSYTPVVGDAVILSWNAAVPSVVGKITTTAAPPPPPAPITPPPATNWGTKPYPASDSGTYWPGGGWRSWAGGGSRVFQGSAGAGPVYGAWFYAGSPSQLAGKTITAIRFTLGARWAVGNHNSPITLHLYTHGNSFMPGSGDVSRLSGPHDIVVQPGQGLTTYDLPLYFAPDLLNGGGIAIAGEPYAGFSGVTNQPESGLLNMDWSA